MLMSDGCENSGNASAVSVGNVPVHTFGFDKPEVHYNIDNLQAIICLCCVLINLFIFLIGAPSYCQ